MSYKTEFPEFELGDGIAIPEGFRDQSWHNDAMPKFVKAFDDGAYILWVDYASLDARDYTNGNRFMLCKVAHGEYYETDGEILAHTDDFVDILNAIKNEGA